MIKQYFFANTHLSRYTLFTLLFQGGMALSLAAMPLYFKNQNAVSAYGMAYSAMAITGALSFVYGVFVDKIGFARALFIGAILYAIALSMRLLTTPILAVMTAVMAGIGASLTILANRSWVLQLSQADNQNTTQLTAMRSILMNAGMLFGTALVAILVYVLGDIYHYLLIMASGLVLIAALFAYQNITYYHPKTSNHNPINHRTETTNHTQPNRLFKSSLLTLPIVLFVVSDFIAGLYTGLFKPYLILMFVDYGLSEPLSVVVFLFTNLVSIVAGVVLLRYNLWFKNRSLMGFFISMWLLVLVYLGMAWLLNANLDNLKLSLVVLVMIVLCRSVFLSMSSNFEQVLQYDLLNKSVLAAALGLTQTAFLAGDALGSLITSLWVVPKNNHDYAQICLYCAVLVFVQMGVMLAIRVYQSKNYNPN